MAKNKKAKKPQQQTHLSPERYIREKARTLEIGTCYATNNIKECGEGQVIVTRRHKGGKTSIAIYMIDTFCLGVKDSTFKLRLDENELEHLLMLVNMALDIHEVTYNEAHNLIYGAVAFAEEGGIKPDKSFALTKYMLEEDTDDVPLIEFEYGRNGKHCLMANSKREAEKYLPTLKKHLGDNFDVTIMDDEKDEDEHNEDDNPNLVYTKYTYKHPDYPTSLELENPQVKDILSSEKPLNKDEIDTLLALPHDSLRRDLEAVLLDCMAKTCDGITEEMWMNNDTFEAINAATLLTEVGNDGSSLDTLLEMLRQPSETLGFFFGDYLEETLTVPLYALGKDKLGKLMDFFKEEGLYDFSKTVILAVVEHIAKLQPERRKEITEWLREAIRFATEKLPEAQYIESLTAAFIASCCAEMKMTELLPELKEMFATGLVDTDFAGDYEYVAAQMHSKEDDFINYVQPDIYEQFDQLK